MNIPSGWKSFHLKDVTYESRTRAASEKATHLVVFGVNNQTGLSTDSRYHADNLDRYKIVKPGMFAYNPMRLNIGSIGYCNEAIGQGLVSPDYVVFGCEENQLDPEYFSYCIQEHRWRNWVQRAGAGSVRIRIYYKDIGIYPIILPSLHEQRKIVEVLSTWDKAIAKMEKLLVSLQTRKRGLLECLLTGRVRFPEFVQSQSFVETKIGALPSDWKTSQIKNVSSMITNGFVGIATPHYTEKSDGVIYIQGFNVRKNRIDLTGVNHVTREFANKQQKSQLESGDMLTVQSGHIGTTAVVPSELAGANCHAVIITRFFKEIADSHYVAYYLNSSYGARRLKSIEVGSSVPHINTKDLKKFIVPIPPLPEQRKIIEVLQVCDTEINLHTKKLKILRQQKKGLMQRLLTGLVRVKIDTTMSNNNG